MQSSLFTLLLLMLAAAVLSTEALAAPIPSDGGRLLQTEQNNATCPPCPQCNVATATEEPITVQILVVDSQGIVDMGE